MRKIENRKLRIEDICITVIERLIRQGYLEWKRKPDGKTEEEMEAKLDKHVILEKDVKEIGNSGIDVYKRQEQRISSAEEVR